jgi:heat shock protein HtpX
MFDSSKKNKRKTYGIVSLFLVFLAIIVYFIMTYCFDVSGSIAIIVSMLLAILTSWVSYYNSDKIVLSLNGARPATKEEHQRMVENLEGLCIAAGLPVPKLYIMDDGSPNAFATGRDPEHGVICVTTGLLEKLDSNELEGVLAHELSHIKNYDTLLQTIASVFVGFVTILSDLFFRIGLDIMSDSDSDNKATSAVGIIGFIGGVIFLALSPLFANLLKLALSRNREFLADSSAIELTRNPDGLISALQKISTDTDPLEQANKSTECMYIYNPIKDKKGKTSSLFSTHPSVEDRIEALKNIH